MFGLVFIFKFIFVCCRSILSVCRVYKLSVSGIDANIEAVLSSNKILVILDLLLQHLEVCFYYFNMIILFIFEIFVNNFNSAKALLEIVILL